MDVDLQFWTPQRLATSGYESTTNGEVTPRWITSMPVYNPVAAKVVSGDATIQSPGRTPFDWASRVQGSGTSTLEISTAWFPGWEARVDGQSVSAGPDASGLLTLQVPPGDHLVEVFYGRGGFEKLALGISIAALILTIAAAMFLGGWRQEAD